MLDRRRLIDAAACTRSSEGRLHREFPASPPSVAAVRDALVAWASEHGATQPTIEALRLAASEAATNVVQHAYRDTAEPGPLEVRAECEGPELRVIIADTGLGLKPHTESPGLGLGLALIAAMADDVVFASSKTGGVEVRMMFLNQEPATAASPVRALDAETP